MKLLNEWANQISHYYLSLGARKGDVIAVMIENRSELIATIVGLAKIGVTIALVNTSQVGKVLAHSINLVKPIAVIAGEEVRAAIDEIRQDLNVPKDRFHWFADQATRQNSGTAPEGYVNLADQIDQFQNSIRLLPALSLVTMVCSISTHQVQQVYQRRLFSSTVAGH